MFPRFIRPAIALLLLGFTKACPDLTWPGDGYCDPDCNTAEFQWDGGDCCEGTCVDSVYDCGINDYDCKNGIGESKYLFTKKYSGFEVTLLCDKEAQAGYTVGYSYSLTKDQNDLGTKRRYNNDPTVPDECQQQFRGSSMPSYRTEQCNGGNRQRNPFCYDRGHIVMANHMDGTSQTREDASYVTNLSPQASGFNQGGGSWKATEDIIECHRDFADVERLDIFGGILYDDESNDFFFESHGIPTPDTFYKVVVKYFKDAGTTPDVIAWVMKNDSNDRAFKLDKKYNGDKDGGDLIEVKQLKRLVNDSLSQLPSTFTEKAYRLGSSWDILSPQQCKAGDSNAEFSRTEL